MGRALRLVLGDQLSTELASLRGAREGDLALMAEVVEEATYVRHHKKKIIFIFAAMRRFARELREQGFDVRYVRYDEPETAASIEDELRRTLASHGPFERVIATACGEWRLASAMAGWAPRLGVPVDILDDDRFLCPLPAFNAWAEGRKRLRMEDFYREMRRRTGLMMQADEPIGGRWNFDAENRKRPGEDYRPPERLRFDPDAETRAVVALVGERFPDHFGELDDFDWGVSRQDALAALDHFVSEALPTFGDYQDAMLAGEPFLSHSLVSLYLNVGLLDPLECCRAAEGAFEAGHAPLNAVEGFIRQIIGWREYVRGVYWRFMPAYKAANALAADRPLPTFYWTGETDLACVADVVRTTGRHAYAHHIQRLMVTGNFALLAGVAPDEINAWYLAVYADAFEWVQLPNTHGMAIYADDGLMASKPYAASGAYIDRMSNYCASCAFDVKAKSGPTACPFNYLYWDFLMRNRQRLATNHRLGVMFKQIDRFDDARRAEIHADAQAFLSRIGLDAPTEMVR